MLHKQLRKDFMRAVSKATLILLLPVTMSLPMAAGAQEAVTIPQAAQTTQTETAPAAASQDVSVILKEGATETILLKEAKDRNALVRQYPFLKETLEQVSQMDAEGGSRYQTEIMVSKLRDAESNTNLLFVYLRGSQTCGSLGCTLNVYSDTGKGYQGAFGATVTDPIYVSKTGGKMSMFFCTLSLDGDNWKPSRAEWSFTDGIFDLKEIVTRAPKTGPSCGLK